MKQQVRDKTEFIAFLEDLYNDYLTNGETWENPTLERFLEAMIGYGKAIQGSYDFWNLNINANVASWQVFADILQGATIYE